MKCDTSKLIHFDHIKNVETLHAQIENHLTVFGQASVEYQKCRDFGITADSLVNENRTITHGTLLAVITPRGQVRTLNTGISLARMSKAEVKQAIKEAKTATKTKQRIRN